MQLVEEGKLELDADMNSYLDFRIPDTYPQPITLRHLMTHTAGFENRDIGMLAPSPETVVPIGQWLAARRLQRSVRRATGKKSSAEAIWQFVTKTGA